jgi:GT2 family glycosyltransferase
MNDNIRPTLCLGIPTINRKDLLDEALPVYKETFKNRHIFVIDNGNQGFESQTTQQLAFWCNGTNLGVAASWNKIIERQRLLGYSHVLILNDDVVLTKKAREIEDFIQLNPADLYTGHGWYSFVIPIETFVKVGPFDEMYYPAYYEDTDYQYRLQVAGLKTINADILLPDVLRKSKSGEKDPTLYDKVFECRRYYETKWGGPPSHEKYTTPFNQ